MGAVYPEPVRVIARRTLREFVRNCVGRQFRKAVTEHLDTWFAITSRARWKNSAELKEQFGSASIVSSERVVFNIKGNHYRLVAAVDYKFGIVRVLWLGTHREYDEINVTKIQYDKERYANSTDPE
jgi:mRNA interferase HigB